MFSSAPAANEKDSTQRNDTRNQMQPWTAKVTQNMTTSLQDNQLWMLTAVAGLLALFAMIWAAKHGALLVTNPKVAASLSAGIRQIRLPEPQLFRRGVNSSKVCCYCHSKINKRPTQMREMIPDLLQRSKLERFE